MSLTDPFMERTLYPTEFEGVSMGTYGKIRWDKKSKW
jgi:hypothetical protein